MDYVSYWDNVLTKEQCDDIINRFETHKEQHEDTFYEGTRHFTEITITKYQDTWGDVQNLLLDKIGRAHV